MWGGDMMPDADTLARAAAMLHVAADYLIATGAADPMAWSVAHEIATELYTAAKQQEQQQGEPLKL